MASDVGIANAALRKLGQSPITSFSEANKAGRIANERFAESRDALLAEHPWNFALKRVSLAASATAPEWGYNNAFPLPTDYIRMYEVEGESLPLAVPQLFAQFEKHRFDFLARRVDQVHVPVRFAAAHGCGKVDVEF